MKIGVLGSADRQKAWQKICGENTECTWVQNSKVAGDYDIFIDLNFDESTENILDYAGNAHTVFLLSSVTCTPEMALAGHGLKYGGEMIFGINAIPGFLERQLCEISDPFSKGSELISGLAPHLPWNNYEWVNSRVGMVTPRIVFMIINEAYYTMQEGTASAPDIDQAMKLGTAYPHGPFEWMSLAGIGNVYRTLEAMYRDTGEERYKICPSLKTAYLNSLI